MSKLSKAVWARLVLAATVLGLSACGGGAGDASETQAGVSSGGTGSFSSGPVTSFGSIVVNGIHFEQGQARVSDAQGQILSPADIKLGMMVELSGAAVEHVGTRDQAKASEIRIVKALVGSVDSVSADALVVMGQTVTVSSQQTHFDDALPNGLRSLAVNDVVTVYGFHDARRDVYMATRIERQSGAVPARYVVHGVIQDLDPLNGRCRIGQQTIVYRWGAETVGLVNGRVATAQVSTSPYVGPAIGGGTQTLWQGELMTLDKPIVSDKDQASLDGVVTSLALDAAGVIAVNGIAVDTRQMVCAACSSLNVGDRIQVVGRLVNEVVVASKLTVQAPD